MKKYYKMNVRKANQQMYRKILFCFISFSFCLYSGIALESDAQSKNSESPPQAESHKPDTPASNSEPKTAVDYEFLSNDLLFLSNVPTGKPDDKNTVICGNSVETKYRYARRKGNSHSNTSCTNYSSHSTRRCYNEPYQQKSRFPGLSIRYTDKENNTYYYRKNSSHNSGVIRYRRNRNKRGN